MCSTAELINISTCDEMWSPSCHRLQSQGKVDPAGDTGSLSRQQIRSAPGPIYCDEYDKADGMRLLPQPGAGWHRAISSMRVLGGFLGSFLDPYVMLGGPRSGSAGWQSGGECLAPRPGRAVVAAVVVSFRVGRCPSQPNSQPNLRVPKIAGSTWCGAPSPSRGGLTDWNPPAPNCASTFYVFCIDNIIQRHFPWPQCRIPGLGESAGKSGEPQPRRWYKGGPSCPSSLFVSCLRPVSHSFPDLSHLLASPPTQPQQPSRCVSRPPSLPP